LSRRGRPPGRDDLPGPAVGEGGPTPRVWSLAGVGAAHLGLRRVPGDGVGAVPA